MSDTSHSAPSRPAAPRSLLGALAVGSTVTALMVLSSACAVNANDASVATLDDEQRDQLAGMMEEEDRRPDAVAAGELVAGLASENPLIRGVAARGLGRLQDPAAIPIIGPALIDEDAGVRREAANGIAQSVFGQEAGGAGDLLHARLTEEDDAAVRGAIAQALGRLGPTAPGELERSRDTLVALTRGAPIETMVPTMRGLESLTRANRADFEPTEEARVRIAELVRYGRSGAEGHVEPTDDDEADLAAVTASARVRRLALATLATASAADADTVETALYDPDVEVRRLAAAAASSIDDPTTQAMLLGIALADNAGQVRYEGLRGYGARLKTSLGCGPILEALEDEDPHVALQAIDMLAGGCPSVGTDRENDLIERLRTMALSLPGLAASENRNDSSADGVNPPVSAAESASAPPVAWHRGAHALIALADLDPAEAAALIPAFGSHPVWQVRMYAALAADAVGAIDTLEQLVADPQANVAEAALRGLTTHVGSGATGASVRALDRDDYQLLITAADSLEASSDADALPALLAALDRITSQQRETSRDPRRALLERIGELGGGEHADALRPYVNDFDPTIARQAADILLAWTGTNTSPAPSFPAPQPFPSLDELVELDRSRALIYMEGGGVIEIALHALEAPTNVARFVDQARGGYFEGLTFHRVVPNFVIQGGSPGANEYVGAGPFSRDELSGDRSHLRGTVGISTRGRDTGDSQIFVNLVDNVRLDHNFTIIGTVVEGMDVVDAVLEGSTILRVTVEPIPDTE